MENELKVEKGERVGVCWDFSLKDIVTVTSISSTGVISVETSGNKRYQYDARGYGRGRAWGVLRKLKEGEEEKFLAEKKAEWHKVSEERKQKEAKRAQELEIYREWVKANAWDINSIQTVNCTLYIISLPIPDELTTLVLRFDKRDTWDKKESYHVSIGIHRTEGDYISGGHTSATIDRIDPLEIAADWMQTWIRLDKLTEKSA